MAETNFGPERGILAASANFGVEATVGISDRARQSDIDAHIAKFEKASKKERATGKDYAAAFISNGATRNADLTAGTLCAIAQMAGLKRSQISKLWDRIRDLDDRLWAAALTPYRTRRRLWLDENPEMAEFAAGVFLDRRGHVSDAAIWDVVRAKFNLEKRQQESVEWWVRRFRIKHRAKIIIACNPDRARSLFLPAHGKSDEGIEDFLEEGQLDGSPSDSLTISTRSGRRRLIAIIDVYTRLPVVVVAPAESTAATGRLIIKANRRYGIFRRILTDHGSGFVSELMRMFLAAAGVECLDRTGKYSPQGKGIVEAFIRELQRFLELTLGFAGHDVSQRRNLRGHLSMSARRGKLDVEILDAKYTDEELEALIDEWIETIYAHRPHQGLAGMTPYQKLVEWQRRGGKARRIEDEAALFGILAERGSRRVLKKGIKVDGFNYTAPPLAAYPDEEIEFRRLPDAGQLAVYLKDQPEHLICIALNDELLGTGRQARALEAGETYRQFTKNVRTAARRLIKGVGGNPAEILLSAASENGRVEVATIPFSTPALEASAGANKAAAAIDVPSNVITLPVERRDEDLSARRRANYERLLRIPATELSEEQRAWMRVYEHFDGDGMPLSLGRASS